MLSKLGYCKINMDTRLLRFIAIILVALVVGSHASPSSFEEYWHKKLPKTPMPKTIHDLLYSEEGTGVTVGNKGVDVRTGKPGKGSTDVHVGKRGKGKHASVYVGGKHSPFIYQYAATKTQLQDNQNVALFFQEKDLKPGTQMNLHFIKTTNEPPVLPRTVADSIPFSSSKMTNVFHRFHVSPNSESATAMKETVKECEAKPIEGEEKYCATSLESMLDYATSKLGKNIEVVTTYIQKKVSKPQEYVFKEVIKKVCDPKPVICHKLKYVYGVFYCHKTNALSKIYEVDMVGKDDTKIKAVVICHTDTSKWNPKHLAFQVLKIKPGTVPVCHFLPEDHFVWISE